MKYLQSVKTTTSQKVSNECLLRILPSTPPQSASVPQGDSTFIMTAHHDEPPPEQGRGSLLWLVPLQPHLNPPPVSYKGPPDKNKIREESRTALKILILLKNLFLDSGQHEDMAHWAFLNRAERILGDSSKYPSSYLLHNFNNS